MEDGTSIQITKTGKWYAVHQGGRVSVDCQWDEMLALIAALTMPEPRPCLGWMEDRRPKSKPRVDYAELGM